MEKKEFSAFSQPPVPNTDLPVVNPDPRPLVTHLDDIPTEGEGSDFHSVCRWRTLLGLSGDPNRQSRTTCLTVGLAHVFPGSPRTQHAHLHDEIYYIIKGKGVTTIRGVDYSTNAGTALFIPGGETHGFRCTDESGSEPADLLYAFAADSFDDIVYDHTGFPMQESQSPESQTVIVHEDTLEWEGEDTAFGPSCKWRTLISSDRFPTANLTVCITVMSPHTAGLLHSHVVTEMYFILKGTGVVTLGHITQAVRPGSVVFVPSGCKHKVDNNSDEPLEFVDILAVDSITDVEFRFGLDIKNPKRQKKARPSAKL